MSVVTRLESKNAAFLLCPVCFIKNNLLNRLEKPALNIPLISMTFHIIQVWNEIQAPGTFFVYYHYSHYNFLVFYIYKWRDNH